MVVEAYGSKTRKITTTGAVTSVDVATLQTPATSLANMLGGRVAGIISTQGSGEPGKISQTSGYVVSEHLEQTHQHLFSLTVWKVA